MAKKKKRRRKNANKLYMSSIFSCVFEETYLTMCTYLYRSIDLLMKEKRNACKQGIVDGEEYSFHSISPWNRRND